MRDAQALAEALSARADLESLRYPGLPSDPAHEIASRQMARFGSVVCFTLDERRACRGVSWAPAACSRTPRASAASTTTPSAARAGAGDDVPEGFIRFSAGCEDTQDVIEDVEQALDASAGR